jgi:hypothetical protein
VATPEKHRTKAPGLFAALSLLLLATPAHALRVVNYNILNYPGSTGAARDPLFRTILAPLAADIVVAGEMTSDAGCSQFLASLNTMEPGEWARSPFMNGNDTDSELFYKPAKVQLLGQWAFYPNAANLLRYVHVYRLQPVGYSSGAAEIRIYALHLKASQGFEAQRLAEATGLRDSLNAMPPGTHALVLGDFNFYSGNEPGFLKLLESQPNNTGRTYDPLGLQGISWQDNTSMKWAWTQSPCKTGDTGCAAGAATGGIDDRFDLILPTFNFQDGAGLELVGGSYIAVGNDGQHHNNSIMDPPAIPEGAAYASALHSVSDHLPVRVDVRLPAMLTLSQESLAFGSVITGVSAELTLTVDNPASDPGETLHYTFTPPAGFLASLGPQDVAAGDGEVHTIELVTTTPGAFHGSLQVTSNALDLPNRNVALSGTVLRHAVPSLDSASVQAASSLDFGTHEAGAFTPLDVRVHNQAYDALQSRLHLASAAITGGDGRFAVSGTTPQLLGGTGATYTVTFDATGATADSTYEATLTFASADEALPGAQPAPPLSVSLSARRQAAPLAVEPPFVPSATVLKAPAPNPLASSGSMLRFDLAAPGETRLEVFDAAGRRVATLVRTSLEPGRYSVSWNGHGERGEALGAGLYFVRLHAPATKPQMVRLAIVR